MSGAPRTYHGSCHCGEVVLELQAQLAHVFECNCSICRRKGALWHAAQQRDVRIVKGEEALTQYQFGSKTAQHYFCQYCGVHPLSRPRFDPSMWVVNVRCIDELDLKRLTVGEFDGRNWEHAARALLESRRR